MKYVKWCDESIDLLKELVQSFGNIYFVRFL
jgi:hypothetical protein